MKILDITFDGHYDSSRTEIGTNATQVHRNGQRTIVWIDFKVCLRGSVKEEYEGNLFYITIHDTSENSDDHVMIRNGKCYNEGKYVFITGKKCLGLSVQKMRNLKIKDTLRNI
jgi:hypothetical protein